MANQIQFAVSTTAFRRQPIESVLALAEREGFALEFSSGLPHRQDMEEIFRHGRVQRIPHNYFPAPRAPFVLNLASGDKENLKRSRVHCLNGLKLAADVDAPFFSVHAGFCIDPRPAELGRMLSQQEFGNRTQYWEVFLESVDGLADQARRLGVHLLIENNVIAPFNLYPDGRNPLLGTEVSELLLLMKQINRPECRLLIDTGHLKVSGHTQKFSHEAAIRQLAPWIEAFHHSDNSGLEDTNEPISEQYWFLPFMNQFKDRVHILEVHDQSAESLHRQIDLLKSRI